MLRIGGDGLYQVYQVDSLYEDEQAAREGLCEKAINFNVVGFLEWLGINLSSTSVNVRTGTYRLQPTPMLIDVE
jgi:hypothetical protein